jgi:hypothetical protein
MFDAQQVAEIREMKERWVIPPIAPPTADLTCDDEVKEWLSTDASHDIAYVFVGKQRPRTSQDAQVASRASLADDELRHRFLDLAQQWEDETGHLSSPNQRMLHPSYKAILGMGQEHKEELIDLLIQDMKDKRRQWFWALSYLAQVNPIKPEDAGRIDRMINAWVRWGEKRERP